MAEVDDRARPFATGPLNVKIGNLIEKAATLNCVSRGANETLKAVNKGKAALVVLAADTEPLEIILHLVLVCEDKDTPYVFIPSKTALGRFSFYNKEKRDVVAVAVIKNDAYEADISECKNEIEKIE